MNTKKESPSMDEWLREAKADPSASKIGMYLTHNGVVRETAKAKVRFGAEDMPDKSRAPLGKFGVGILRRHQIFRHGVCSFTYRRSFP